MTLKRDSIYRICYREKPVGERLCEECIEPALESLCENAAHASVMGNRENCGIQVYGSRLIRVVPPRFSVPYGIESFGVFIYKSYFYEESFQSVTEL